MKPTHRTPKPSTPRKKPIKIVDFYQDLFTLREKPVSQEVIKRILSEALHEAIRNPKLLKLTTYFRERGLSHQTIKRWAKTYPWAQELYDETKQAIGDNRELGALTNKLNASMVMYNMPLYDPEWMEMLKLRESLKHKDPNQGAQTINVYASNFGLDEPEEV